MPCTPEAIDLFEGKDIMVGPAKAANAGGVAVSGLEMAQNSQKLQWTAEQVDDKLKEIMSKIYSESISAAREYGSTNLRVGANIAGFLKVAKAMIAQGCV